MLSKKQYYELIEFMCKMKRDFLIQTKKKNIIIHYKNLIINFNILLILKKKEVKKIEYYLSFLLAQEQDNNTNIVQAIEEVELKSSNIFIEDGFTEEGLAELFPIKYVSAEDETSAEVFPDLMKQLEIDIKEKKNLEFAEIAKLKEDLIIVLSDVKKIEGALDFFLAKYDASIEDLDIYISNSLSFTQVFYNYLKLWDLSIEDLYTEITKLHKDSKLYKAWNIIPPKFDKMFKQWLLNETLKWQKKRQKKNYE